MKRCSWTQRTLLAIVLLGTHASCAHKPSESPASVALPGTSWQVETIERRGVEKNTDATMAFNTDGRISGSTSCSNYTGMWTIQGQKLTFSTLAVTYQTCAAPLTDQERRFLKAAFYVQSYRIDSKGRLRLIGREDTEMMRLKRIL